jgi:hypothetical protein
MISAIWLIPAFFGGAFCAIALSLFLVHTVEQNAKTPRGSV